MWPWYGSVGDGRDGGSRLKSHTGPVATTDVRSSVGLSHQLLLHRPLATCLQSHMRLPCTLSETLEGEMEVCSKLFLRSLTVPSAHQILYSSVQHQIPTQAPTKASPAFLPRGFLQNQGRWLSLHVATAQKRKRNNTSQSNPQQLGSRGQWINAPASCPLKNYFEVLSTNFFRAPVAHSSNQLNKVPVLDFLPFLFHPPYFLIVLPGIISPKLPVPWFVSHSAIGATQPRSYIS